ncbi:MAG: hypothetical protein K9G26_05860 [Emcibacter sp.]|nr:hypothetical protein [Emcibacter sp.]
MFAQITEFASNNKDFIQLVLAVATSIAAILALFISFLQGSWQRKHDRLSVKPYLQLTFENNITSANVYECVITLSNVGLGPAMLNKFTLLNGVSPILFEDVFEICFFDIEGFNRKTYTIDPSIHVIPVNDERILFHFVSVELGTPEQKQHIQNFLFDDLPKRFAQLSIEVGYTSLHGGEQYTLFHKGSDILDIKQKQLAS